MLDKILVVLICAVLVAPLIQGTSQTIVTPANLVTMDSSGNINVGGVNASGFWWNNVNRTDLLAHPQDSYNFLVFREGDVTYAKTGNTAQVAPSTIQACVDAVTVSGGSVIVKNGTYSEAVVLKNATRLVLDRGCVGVTVSINAGATAILEDYNNAITSVYSTGTLVIQYNNVNGLIAGNYSNFNQYWTGVLNRTDAVVNPEQPFQFIVYAVGTTYMMKNGSDGQIKYQNTNLTLVEQYALGNMTSGLLYMKEVVHNTSLALENDEIIIECYQGKYQYYSNLGMMLIPQLAGDPSTAGWGSPEQGRMWYDTTTGKIKFWDGTNIQELPSYSAEPSVGSTGLQDWQYLVWRNTTAAYLVSGNNDQIIASNADAATVINWALGNLTSGRSRPEVVALKGAFEITTDILMPTRSILTGYGARLWATNSYADGKSIIRNTDFSGGNSQIYIYGVEVDGRRSSQGAVNHFGIRLEKVAEFSIEDTYVHDINKDNNDGGRGINVADCSYGSIIDNRVDSCNHSGIHVGSNDGGLFSHDIVVSKNIITNIGESALYSASGAICVYGYSGYENQRIDIIGNIIQNSSNQGIQVYRYSHHCNVVGNQISGVRAYSIIGGTLWVPPHDCPVNYSTVVGNVITVGYDAGGQQMGIRWAGSHCTISGNTIHMDGNGLHGIEAILSFGAITGNMIYGSPDHGIVLDDNATSGYYSYHTTISGNTLDGTVSSPVSGQDGIRIEATNNNNTIGGNTIFGFDDEAIDVEGDYNFIHDNNCNGSDLGGEDNGSGNVWRDNIDENGAFVETGVP